MVNPAAWQQGSFNASLIPNCSPASWERAAAQNTRENIGVIMAATAVPKKKSFKPALFNREYAARQLRNGNMGNIAYSPKIGS